MTLIDKYVEAMQKDLENHVNYLEELARIYYKQKENEKYHLQLIRPQNYFYDVATDIFENELEKGTGVPYMLIKNGIIKPSLKIDSILLDNIIYDKTVDHKRKGSRAEYLYKIISIYDNKAGIFSEVLRFFQKNTLDKYYDEQLFDFVLEMVKDGKADKKILYNKVRFYINKNDEFCGIKSFIEYFSSVDMHMALKFVICFIM